MKLSKTLIVVIVLGVLLLMCIPMYNGLVKSEEAVNSTWANVESSYQRRTDLIGNLVQTVQGAADFERSTLTDVMQARASATSMKIDPSNLDESNLAVFQKVQEQLSGALSRLLVTVERYPELKATQSFRDLQAQLEGTENRINVERNKFNEAARTYNTAIRRFPRNMVAGLFGFDRKAYFQSAEGSDQAPSVEFDFKKQ